MLVPQVRCNLCRCIIDSDGERLRGGIGLLQVFSPSEGMNYQIAEYPIDSDARIHLCTPCLNAIKNMEIEPKHQ